MAFQDRNALSALGKTKDKEIKQRRKQEQRRMQIKEEKRERGKREKSGEEGWWGQREGSQRTTYGSDSVITANLWSSKGKVFFSMPPSLHIKLPL